MDSIIEKFKYPDAVMFKETTGSETTRCTKYYDSQKIVCTRSSAQQIVIEGEEAETIFEDLEKRWKENQSQSKIHY